MPYSRVDVNSLCFPQHNGHRAWHYYAKNIEDAAIEDLFWRKVQVSPHFTTKVVRTVWPEAKQESNGLLILPNQLYVSLCPESCGAYTTLGMGWDYPLRGDSYGSIRLAAESKRQPHMDITLNHLCPATRTGSKKMLCRTFWHS